MLKIVIGVHLTPLILLVAWALSYVCICAPDWFSMHYPDATSNDWLRYLGEGLYAVSLPAAFATCFMAFVAIARFWLGRSIFKRKQ